MIIEINFTDLKKLIYNFLSKNPLELGFNHPLEFLFRSIPKSKLFDLIFDCPSDDIKTSLIGLAGRLNTIPNSIKLDIFKKGLQEENLEVREMTIYCIETWEHNKELYDVLKNHLQIESNQFLQKYIKQLIIN